MCYAAARKWGNAQAGAGVAGPSQLCGNGGYLRSCIGRIEKNNGRNYVESFGKQQCGLTFQDFLTDDWQTSKTWKSKVRQKVMKKPCFHRKHGFRVAAEEGFEPSQTESESVVLPLHNSALSCATLTVYNIQRELSSEKCKKIWKDFFAVNLLTSPALSRYNM